MQQSPATNLHIGMLQDMGFPETRCREALRLAGDRPELAMEWLLQQGAEAAGAAGAADDGGSIGADSSQMMDASFSLGGQGADSETDGELDEAVVGMLAGMGFSRAAVLAALQDCENDPDAACALLMDGDFDGSGVPPFRLCA